MTRTQKLRRILPVLAVLSLAAFAPTAQAGTAYDTFTATGNLKTSRAFPLTTVLPNGKVLIASGLGENFALNTTTEIYNPATGTTAASGALRRSHGWGTATLLPTGKVLLVGGFSNIWTRETLQLMTMTATAELYDPATGKSTSTESLMKGRALATATLLPGGKVLIAGGLDMWMLGSSSPAGLASAEIYNPKTGQFTPTGDMTEARWGATAALLPNGKVLIAGGGDQETGLTTGVATAEIYNPATGKFTATGSLKTPRTAGTATTLPNGKILITGGEGFGTVAHATAELYNPATGTFAYTGSLHEARSWTTATLLANGKVLIAGGGGDTGALKLVELYNPATGTFELTGSLTATHGNGAAALLQNGKVLILGANATVPGPGDLITDLYNPTPAAPGKPVVKWGSANKSTHTITATVTPVSGTAYVITGKLGAQTKTGECVTAGSKVKCTLSPGKGKWAFSVTPHNDGGNGAPNSKTVTV